MLLNQKFHKCKGSYLPLSKPRGGPVGGAQASPALITRALRCWFSLAPSRLCPEESTAWEEEADHQGHTWDRGEGSLVQFYRLRVQGHHHWVQFISGFVVFSLQPLHLFVRCNPNLGATASGIILHLSPAARCKYTEMQMFALWPS